MILNLKQNPLLKNLTDEEWFMFETLLKKPFRYHKKAFIYMESDQCKTVDFIVEGSVYVKRHDLEGRTLMVERFLPGDFLGANLLFSSKPTYPMDIIAETDCVLVKVPKPIILSWCQGNMAFLETYMQELSDRAKILVSTIHKLSTGTLRERLLEDFDKIKDEKNKIFLSVSKKEMAERYGVARTSLSRELNKMEEEGILKKLSRNAYQLLK
ncbi:MAG: Crp/Fnr family transcriptional regulator [Clostridia bacterium]|nr:Crp/Fnr family transcriptional regulator [Clostridia bacterium]